MSEAEVARQATEWLRFAREDRQSARAMLASRGQFEPRHACFAAQQAAEKALKAVCVARRVAFPFTHDLEQLANLLGPANAAARATSDLAWLSQWSVTTRYPDEDDEEPGWPDAERSLFAADRVVDAASQDLWAA